MPSDADDLFSLSAPIRSVEDLEIARSTLNEFISTQTGRTDACITDKITQKNFVSSGTAFLEEQDAIAQAIDQMRLQLEEAQSHSEIEDRRLSPSILEELESLSHLERHTKIQLLIHRTKLLSQFLWTEIASLHDSVSTDGDSEIPLEQIVRIYRMLHSELHAEIDEVCHGVGLPFEIRASMQAELYSVNENLIQAFLLFKEKYTEAFSHFASTAIEDRFSFYRTHLLQEALFCKQQIQETMPKAAEFMNTLFEKKRVQNPKELLTYSLEFASRYSIRADHVTSISGGDATGLSVASITAGFALPCFLLYTYRIRNTIARKARLESYHNECREIAGAAHILKSEALAMVNRGRLLLQNTEESDSIKEGKNLLQHGNALLAVATEVESKALGNDLLIQEHLEKLPLALASFTLGALSDGSEIISSVGEILEKMVHGFSSTPVCQALHFVGVAAGALGVIVGGIGIGVSSTQIHTSRIKIATLKNELSHLETTLSTLDDSLIKTRILMLEKTRIEREIKKESVALKNSLLSLASSVLLTVAGILGTAALLGTGVAFGYVTIALLALIAIATLISIAHSILKRKWCNELEMSRFPIEEEKELIRNLAKDLQILYVKDRRSAIATAAVFSVPSSELEGFFTRPETLLQMRYQEQGV